MAPSFAPSFSTPKLIHEYEVFVSFRGADNRTGFTSHLFAALDRKTIHAFKDDINLPGGEKIGPELLRAIETSRIAVVVFSKKYATSDWCLDELVKIMECKRVFNQRVFPIFYNVSQPEVLEQKGNFAELPNGPEDKRNSWRAALTEAANLAGLHFVTK
ncbi:disease resistance protein RPV1-like [Quercus robur]|uniref:disease resistance protein RPV1-like n=1 Tax=Quercus robur TaxID=38942 RepID=UPI0021629F97|nr:disease resistance protein RPV1-like [Quercus robur]